MNQQKGSSQLWILLLGVNVSITISSYLFFTRPSIGNTWLHVALFLLSAGLPIFSIALYLGSKSEAS